VGITGPDDRGPDDRGPDDRGPVAEAVPGSMATAAVRTAATVSAAVHEILRPVFGFIVLLASSLFPREYSKSILWESSNLSAGAAVVVLRR
jgi:hypothetical protein